MVTAVVMVMFWSMRFWLWIMSCCNDAVVALTGMVDAGVSTMVDGTLAPTSSSSVEDDWLTLLELDCL